MQNIAIIITDGQSQKDVESTIPNAVNARVCTFYMKLFNMFDKIIFGELVINTTIYNIYITIILS